MTGKKIGIVASTKEKAEQYAAKHSCTQSPFTTENYRAIEAKLKEKNTCRPTTSTNPR